ncbi:hypothetical protein [Ancylobacter oerskovii]|uniref:Uncharacterized protein n=1 Tax=Ancylobacter oerskovii TaxID=459519 RepID=A0ABW4YRJ1_9HYPH|nr:hypothetical protein [Ancylobacter oerskovii]MBS7545721.1 hypothetical protein [Ancylobacter oerskovii]
MNDRPILLSRGELLELRWTAMGQVRGGSYEPAPNLFMLWRDGQLIGFTSEFEAGLTLGERFARQFGCELIDVTIETTAPEDRPQWPPLPTT